MRTLFFYVLICCFFPLSLIAQQNNNLSGKVLFLNSGNTLAVGVGIFIASKSIGVANTIYTVDDDSYHTLIKFF